MISNATRLAVFEIQKRSLNTYAGWAWSLMNPIAQMGLIYFIMTSVFKSNVENPLLWLISSLTTWTVIQNSVSRSCSSLVSRRALMQNNNISPKLLVAADLLSEILILAPFFAVGIVVSFVVGTQSYNLLYIPLVLGSLLIFLFGIGLVLSSITPFLRDIPYLVSLLMQIAFWLTPIAYAKTTASPGVQIVVQCNPFTYYIEFAQAIFLGSTLSIEIVGIPVAIALVSALIGYIVSGKLSKKLVIHL